VFDGPKKTENRATSKPSTLPQIKCGRLILLKNQDYKKL